MSQGAWIAPMAAALSADVAFVIALSASGTGPREQDRFRIERQLASEGFSQPEIQEALAVWYGRDEGLRRGDSIDSLVAMQRAYADRRWYPYLAFDDHAVLRFIQRIWEFDPVPYLERCRCPLLALWGADDVIVAAEASEVIFERALAKAGNPYFRLVVVPGLGHGLGAEENRRMRPAVFELMTQWVLSLP
jgi:pimeloyl-ACP methyl ester carboxylesterase